MEEKNILIKDKEGNTLYPQTQASLVLTNSGGNLGNVETELQAKANDGEVVHLADAETITGAKTFTQPLKIQNGNGTGSLIIGADVNASTLNNGTGKLARIAVPTQSNKDLMAILLGFDSNGDDALHIKNRTYDAISFGGQTKITNATSPMSLGFCVTKTRNSTAASDKVYTLEMDANEARFNVPPNYNGVNLVTETQLGTKQDALTAGDNIIIQNGVISSTASGGLSYEDLNEEIEVNPTPLIEEWEAYKQQVNATIELYQQEVIALREELNTMKVRYVVETYQNGADWYVVYNDNWCEMGGHLGTASANNYTVTFHKEFRDTNISVLAADGTGTTTGTDTAGVDMSILITNVTTTSFRVSIATTRQNSSWEAKGYIL